MPKDSDLLLIFAVLVLTGKVLTKRPESPALSSCIPQVLLTKEQKITKKEQKIIKIHQA